MLEQTGMTAYQGSDWFKSGVHLNLTAAESKKQLAHQASQQIAEASRRLQVAYDEGLALFKNNFSGTQTQASYCWLASVSSHRFKSV